MNVSAIPERLLGDISCFLENFKTVDFCGILAGEVLEAGLANEEHNDVKSLGGLQEELLLVQFYLILLFYTS